MKYSEIKIFSIATALLLRMTLLTVEKTDACLPRLNLFGFGRNGNRDGTEKPYDADAEEKSKWTTSNWIEQHKHPLELHNITTSDGYQLQLHRLPKPGQRPILLVHGLLTSSLSWVMLGANKSLGECNLTFFPSLLYAIANEAFMLYAKDNDVWLANTRGSMHGRNHTTLTLTEADFWSFSFHEVGLFDLPAIVDYIRDVTSFHQLIVVTHSEAFNSFLVLFSMREEYNERVLLVQAFAPLAQLHDYVKMTTEEVKRIMKFVKAKTKAKSFEVFPAGELRKQCLKQNTDERRECLSYMQMITGSGQHLKSLDPIIFGQLLQGGSLKAIEHLHQLWQSGDFVGFDYGPDGNRRYYNSVEPINYNLSRITVPLVLYFGETDAIATPEGVHSIYSQLVNSVIGVYKVTAEKFNHLDFVCAPEVKTLVNERVIGVLEKFFAGTLHYVIE